MCLVQELMLTDGNFCYGIENKGEQGIGKRKYTKSATTATNEKVTNTLMSLLNFCR